MNTKFWNIIIILSVLMLAVGSVHAQDAGVPDVPFEVVGQITNIDRQEATLTLDDSVIVHVDDLGQQALAGLSVDDTVLVTGLLLDDGSIQAETIDDVVDDTVTDSDTSNNTNANSNANSNNGNGNSNGNANANANSNGNGNGNNGNGNGRGNGNANANSNGNNGNGNGRGNGNANANSNGNNGNGNGRGNGNANANSNGNNGNGNGRGNGNANANSNGNNGNANGNASTSDTSDTSTDKVIVCHTPPGNPNNGHTLSISADSLADHLAQGDVQGPCTGERANRANAADCGSASGKCHPVLSRLSDALGVNYAELEARRDQGYGVGEIARAYLLATYAGVSPQDVFALRDSGMGWGEIFALFPDISTNDLSLGSLVGND